MRKTITVVITGEEIDALGEILDLAHGDQESYMNIGNPHQDYGEEWPFTAREKAERFRLVAALAEKLGLHGELDRWNTLADSMQASGKEYAEANEPLSKCPNCERVFPQSSLKEIQDLGQRVTAGEPMPSGECPECGALCQLVEVY